MGARGRKVHSTLQHSLQVDLPLRLRPASKRGSILDDRAHGEHRDVLFGTFGVRKGGGSWQGAAHRVGSGQSWLAYRRRGGRSPGRDTLGVPPAGSPELMPAERLWALSNEALANALFQEIEEVEEALEERCIGVLEHSEAIRELT